VAAIRFVRARPVSVTGAVVEGGGHRSISFVEDNSGTVS
jgi:hypothetical protein